MTEDEEWEQRTNSDEQSAKTNLRLHTETR